ncbi:helix-turn-helix domain-containing protein [Streptomyces sp. A7024]|uniref:Helix-turn-helix domain-containing protein n=1 Tax=Streptomyces coryli TaxID=1128680 RepID=A0A6G4TT19_9ACTN|nr:helix-turn-helix transcriptional regulator [Streptomyces coryli]NGN63169.1 helix-turn-helix domain-containing protein [Streptomyces coryli]
MTTGNLDGLSSQQALRVTVAALMQACTETQTDLARGLRLTQGQVSRKQTGHGKWSIEDLDKLAAHYGIKASDLLDGPTVAVQALPRVRHLALVRSSREPVTV